LLRIARQLTHTVANFGLVVMGEGEYGEEMWFIEDGEVDVYRQTAQSRVAEVTHTDFRARLGARLGRLGKQGFFGERAVMARGNGLRRGACGCGWRSWN
jgi:CRP-like cAMP-binding protein